MTGRHRNLLAHAGCRYVLIVVAPSRPAGSLASVEVDGMYYYIAQDDVISLRNFRLLPLISTIEAVAPAAPLTQTVSGGGPLPQAERE